MAFKEMLTNIVNHARATEVWMRLRLEKGTAGFMIEDNGRGFDLSGGAGDLRAPVDWTTCASGSTKSGVTSPGKRAHAGHAGEVRLAVDRGGQAMSVSLSIVEDNRDFGKAWPGC